MRICLQILLIGLWVTSIAARPLFPSPEIGTESQAHAGGGTALEGGLHSLWTNPAGLNIVDGSEWEIGSMGVNEGFSPYAWYGSHALERSSYALGYFRDTRLGPNYQGLIGAFTLTPISWWTGGVTVLNTVVGEDFGIDMNAGLILRAGEHWRLGGDIKNIFQQGYGREPEGYASERKVSFGLAYLKDDLAWGNINGLTMSYDFKIYGWNQTGDILPKDFSHVFSLDLELNPQKNMALHVASVLPQQDFSKDLKIMGGFNVMFGIKQHQLGLDYAIADKAKNNTGFGPNHYSHSLSIHRQPKQAPRVEPPKIFAKTDQSTFTLSKLTEAPLHFFLWAENSAHPITHWSLLICHSDSNGVLGDTVRYFEGKELPPRFVAWDGLDERGQLLNAGYYAFSFIAKNSGGRESKTLWQFIELILPSKD